mgnify:CR=1 FL=1
MQIHERHPEGWKNINWYMTNYFKPAKNFESFVYATMVMQGYTIQYGIESLMRNRPYCMGSLYWQLNDVWPVFSWASVDFFGQWKALHFRAKEMYKDTTVFLFPRDN